MAAANGRIKISLDRGAALPGEPRPGSGRFRYTVLRYDQLHCSHAVCDPAVADRAEFPKKGSEMRMTRKLALVVMVVAALIGGTAATATAATSATAAPAACGWTAPLGGNEYANGTTEYWLSYNTCNRTVRGGAIVQDTDFNWHLWVYNETNGNTAATWVEIGTGYTAAISDANTLSHVCIQPYSFLTGAVTGAKVCTGYY